MAFALPPESKVAKEKSEEPSFQHLDEEMSIRIGRAGLLSGKPPFIYPHLQLFFFGWISEQDKFLTCHPKTRQASTAVDNVVLLYLQLIHHDQVLNTSAQNESTLKCVQGGLHWLTRSFSDGFFSDLISLFYFCFICPSVILSGCFPAEITLCMFSWFGTQFLFFLQAIISDFAHTNWCTHFLASQSCRLI